MSSIDYEKRCVITDSFGLDKNQQSGDTMGGVVALVPAKLTSVRLPRKNITDLGGYPMFYYSVRVAQICPTIDAVYVSSEAPEILDLATNYGAEIIARPKELSAPDITNQRVLCHALDEITLRRGVAPELIVLLQPTHPLRLPNSIAQGIDQMHADQNADSLLTVVHNDELRGEICNGRFIPEYSMPRDKTLEPELYRNTGSFYIFRVAHTLALGKMFTDSMLPFKLERPEFEIDVDTLSDLILARCILNANREIFSEFYPENSAL